MTRWSMVLLLVFGVVGLVSADTWPGWRGPLSSGAAVGEGYPTKWDSQTNIAWKFPMPGSSGSTPVVWNDRIFLTCVEDGKNTAVCLTTEGKELWRKSIGQARPGKNAKASGANSSPTTDGQHLFVYYKSGDIAGLDFSGKILWQKNLQEEYGEDTLWWDLGTSPVVTNNAVVVAVMQTGPSYLVALAKATGDELWKQDRNLGAPEEAAQSYSTPVVVEREGKEQIVVLGADHVTCHDGSGGAELWRVGGLNPTNHKYFRSIASPVIAGEVVIAPYARGGSITAIKMGGKGDVTNSHITWFKEGTFTDVPTPTTSGDKVYILSDKGTVTCVAAIDGKQHWSVNLEKQRGKFSSSPILADGRLYLSREGGMTHVLDAATGQTIANNQLSGKTVATPVLVDGRILLQTADFLYCIAN